MRAPSSGRWPTASSSPLEQGVRIVTNAGGLNPAGLVEKLNEVAAEVGVQPRIAWVDGDNLAPRASEARSAAPSRRTPTSAPSGSPVRSRPEPTSSCTGRVTDASLVVGPAIWKHGWTAGAVRRARRRRGGRSRRRVRHPGDRRQLLRLPRPAARRRAAGVPDRRDRGRRQLRDHQARRHRWAGLGRHGDGTADVRGAGRALPRAPT